MKIMLFIKNIVNNPITGFAVRRFCLFFGLFLYTELHLQLLTGTLTAGFLRAGLFMLLCAVLLTFIILCLPKLADFLVSEAAVLFISLLSVSQLLYNKIFHEFFTIDKMSVGGDAISQFGDILAATVRENIPGIIALSLPVFVLPVLYLYRRFPAAGDLRLQVQYITIPVVFLLLLRYSMLIPAAADMYSPRADRYGQADASRISSVSAVGLYTTMEIDLLSFFISTGVSSVLDDIPELPVLSAPVLPPPVSPAPQPPSPGPDLPDEPTVTDDPEEAVPPEEPLPPPWEGKFNSFDIDFEALIERDEKNRGLRQLHEYFSSLEPSAQNEKTGMFEGYNLITICAEAFTKWVIDPELTPTLYMMQHEGVHFENFYSIYGAGTIGGEFTLCTGFPPRGAGGWCTSATRNYLPFTFASRFHDIGIQPLAFHNGSYRYYDRNILFARLGYIFRAFGGPNGLPGGWSSRDLHLIERTIDDYIGLERFYVHYMTVSGHSEYGFGNPMARLNRDTVAHLPYSTEVRAYIACQLEFEYAMAYLLERLEDAGIAEHTLIVITSDHYPYGLAHGKTEELAGKKLSSAHSLHESAGMIYVKGMTPEVVTAPAFVADMLPTVLNLLGLQFDSRFLPGRDVFSGAMPFVYLEGGIITEAGIYEKNRRNFIPSDGVEEVSKEYISAILAIEAARKSAVEQVVRLDYFESIREYIE